MAAFGYEKGRGSPLVARGSRGTEEMIVTWCVVHKTNERKNLEGK